jgi:hypothetical protein
MVNDCNVIFHSRLRNARAKIFKVDYHSMRTVKSKYQLQNYESEHEKDRGFWMALYMDFYSSVRIRTLEY